MSIIGTKIKPFTTQAYKEGKFLTVSDADVLGKWAVFFFYPPISPRLPDGAGGSGRQPRHLRQDGRRSVQRLDRHAFQPQGMADSSPAIGKIRFTMLLVTRRRRDQQFRRDARGPGPADRGTLRRRSRGHDPADGSSLGGRRSQRDGAAPQDQGGAVYRGASGRGLPAKWEEARRRSRRRSTWSARSDRLTARPTSGARPTVGTGAGDILQPGGRCA